MADAPHRLLVCINRRFQVDRPSCAVRGSVALADAVEKGIAERRLNVEMERVVCLGRCPYGPAMRLAPGGEFFLGIAEGDIGGVLDALENACGARSDAEDAPDSVPAHLLGS